MLMHLARQWSKRWRSGAHWQYAGVGTGGRMRSWCLPPSGLQTAQRQEACPCSLQPRAVAMQGAAARPAASWQAGRRLHAARVCLLVHWQPAGKRPARQCERHRQPQGELYPGGVVFRCIKHCGKLQCMPLWQLNCPRLVRRLPAGVGHSGKHTLPVLHCRSLTVNACTARTAGAVASQTPTFFWTTAAPTLSTSPAGSMTAASIAVTMATAKSPNTTAARSCSACARSLAQQTATATQT